MRLGLGPGASIGDTSRIRATDASYSTVQAALGASLTGEEPVQPCLRLRPEGCASCQPGANGPIALRLL